MLWPEPETLVEVDWIDYEQEQAIVAEMRRLVEEWTREKRNKEFKVAELLEGVDPDWIGTPYRVLTNYYLEENESESEARKHAGWDLGKIVKIMLDEEEERQFYSPDPPEGESRSYRYVGLAGEPEMIQALKELGITWHPR